MFKRVSEFLQYLAHESGKISYDEKCPFCSQKLTKERLKAFKIRLGRMQFVFRVYEKTNSQTAYGLLYDVFANPTATRDIPIDHPDWWSKLALELYKEEGGAREKEQ